jgi:hypothetical protein
VLADNAPVVETVSVPALTAVEPVYVFTPFKVAAPLPVLSNAPAPDSTELRVPFVDVNNSKVAPDWITTPPVVPLTPYSLNLKEPALTVVTPV